MEDARRIAKIVASLGVATLVTQGTLRCLRGKQPLYNPIVLEFPRVASAHPALCSELSQLAALGQAGALRDVMRLVECIVALEEGKGKGSEFKIARLAAQVSKSLKDMLEATELWKSDALFNEKRIAEEDTVPAVEQYLENILHNFIGDNSFRSGGV